MSGEDVFRICTCAAGGEFSSGKPWPHIHIGGPKHHWGSMADEGSGAVANTDFARQDVKEWSARERPAIWPDGTDESSLSSQSEEEK